MQRLFSQTKRLKTDPDLLSKYSDIMRGQKETGILEKVPEDAIHLPYIYIYISQLSESIGAQQSCELSMICYQRCLETHWTSF